MFVKKTLVSALLAAGMLGAVAIPLPSLAAAEIWINVAPPPNRTEAVPSPRRGYDWSPGHWQWNASRKRHDWVAGSWERARTGQTFRAPQWVQRDGRWSYQARRWDNDGDGIPNSRDATPNGGMRVAVAPPPNRRESVPAARRGYDWSPGHWQWNASRNRHYWTAGSWVRTRAGQTYRAPEWIQRDGGWVYQTRRWDKDGDGIPNSRDATPNGGVRRGDRDGDGVPNKSDRRPDNPNRS